MEDFAWPAGTPLTAAGWLQSGSTTLNPVTVTGPGLSLDGYSGSGSGNAAALKPTGQDVYAPFPPTGSGTLYYSFLLNVSSAGSGDYLIALSPASSQSSYYARFHVKSTAGGYLVGMSKNNEVTGGARYGSTVVPLDQTVAVVVKYEFREPGAGADSANDAITVWLFSASFPHVEPGGPEIDVYVCPSRPDPQSLGLVTLRQGATSAGSTLVVDAIRIGESWPGGGAAGVRSAEPTVPRDAALSACYPNPFNPATVIRYTVPASDANPVTLSLSKGGSGRSPDVSGRWPVVSLRVYDMLGRETAMLVHEAKPPGTYEVRFDARGLATGVYIAVLTTDGVRLSRKMMLLR